MARASTTVDVAPSRRRDRPCRFDVVSIQLARVEPAIESCRSVPSDCDRRLSTDDRRQNDCPRCLSCEEIPSPAAGSSSPPIVRSGRTISVFERAALARARALSVLPGHEAMTPPEMLAVPARTAAARMVAGWDVRVVPNKFPALQVEGTLDRAGRGHVRSDERHRRARGDHRDARSRSSRWRRCRRRRSSGCCGRSASGCSI